MNKGYKPESAKPLVLRGDYTKLIITIEDVEFNNILDTEFEVTISYWDDEDKGE